MRLLMPPIVTRSASQSLVGWWWWGMFVPIMWSLPTHAGVEFGCDNFLIPAVSELHILSDKTNNEKIAPFDLLCFLPFYI